jgi:RNA polymerase sigma-70 factor, ECF subfamily
MTAIEFNHKIIGLQDKMKSFAFRLTSNHDDAHDLIQETYVKVIKHKDTFDPSTNLKAWIFTIMKNIFINKYRKENKIRKIIDQTADLYYMNNTIQSSATAADAKHNLSELEKMLNDLDEEFRIPFQMHFQGYKYKEIADNLNINIGTVKNKIYFCRQKMIKKLKDFQN